MIKAEWKKIATNRMMLVSLIAILFVPIIYGGMFLWSFWDPYGHLDRMPVAVVNEDKGATVDDKKLDLGDELATKLVDKKTLKFEVVTEAEAEKGMKNRDYYMMIRIPENFSKNAGTLLEDKPEKLKIKYTPNEGINFLGSQIGKSAIETIRSEVNNEVSKTYAEQLFNNIAKMSDGYSEASDGAGKLKTGAGKLTDGAKKLTDGIVSAEDGAGKLTDGATSAKEGSAKLATGITSAANGASQLEDGASSAKTGASKLNEGITSAQSGSTKLETGASELKNGTATLVSGLEGNTTNIEALNNGAQAINGGIGTLTDGLNSLTTGSQSVSAGVTKLVDGLGTMPSTVTKLQTGVANINDGATNLSGATKQVVDGMSALQQQINAMSISAEDKAALLATLAKVSAGAEGVNTGAAQLSAGTAELNNSVSTIALPATNDLSALKAGAAQVATGASTINDKVTKELQPGTEQLAAGTEKLANNWGDSIEGAKKLDAGAGSLTNGISSLNSGLGQLQGGSSQLVTGLGTLQEGTANLTNGMGQLETGASSLTAGLDTLAKGSDSLLLGATKLVDGSSQLSDGTKELQNGSKTLQTKLSDASKEATIKTTDATYDMVSNPVKIDKKAENPVANYGTGFSPYFLSMGLLVGGLVITVIFSIVQPAIRPTSGTSWFLSKTSVLAVVGLLQSVIIVGLVKLLLGLEAEHIVAVFFMALVASYTFIALVQVFVTIFNDVGRFIVLVLMVLQLTSSAGTFPVELIPEPLQAVNKFMPMTYTIQGFKAAISTGDMAFYWQNIGILLAFAAVCLCITFGYFQLLFKKRYSGSVAEEN